MISSKLKSKGQTTIPSAVREALRLRPGDELSYRIEDQRVILSNASRAGIDIDPLGVFSEWSSEADTKGCDRL